MIGAWEKIYAESTEPLSYGDETTYKMGEEWLKGLDVQDWGCGYAWFKRFHEGKYIGIDGSKSPYCDVVTDLCTFTSNTPGLFMRHVLEHNHNWESILKNAVFSFEKRMVLVLFTPTNDSGTKVLAESELAPGILVPDLSLDFQILHDLFQGTFVKSTSVVSDTQYQREHVFYLERK